MLEIYTTICSYLLNCLHVLHTICNSHFVIHFIFIHKSNDSYDKQEKIFCLANFCLLILLLSTQETFENNGNEYLYQYADIVIVVMRYEYSLTIVAVSKCKRYSLVCMQMGLRMSVLFLDLCVLFFCFLLFHIIEFSSIKVSEEIFVYFLSCFQNVVSCCYYVTHFQYFCLFKKISF